MYMLGNGTTDFLEFLGGSRCRVIILSELEENGSLNRSDFNKILDTSRTTITRNLDALIDRDLVERQNRTYRLTHNGKFVASELMDLVEAVQATEKLKPILEQIPPSEFEFEPQQLADGTVTVSNPTDPYAPVNKHIERLESADRVKCLLPMMGLNSMKAAERRILDHGATHELVVDSNVAETFRSDPEYTEPLNRLLETDRLTVYVFAGNIPYYLGILDDTVQIGVSNQGVPQALLETQSNEVNEKAQCAFNDYKSESKELKKFNLSL
jgi:predicted transcriptional regulator